MFIDIQLFNEKKTFVDLRLYFYRIIEANILSVIIHSEKVISLVNYRYSYKPASYWWCVGQRGLGGYMVLMKNTAVKTVVNEIITRAK